MARRLRLPNEDTRQARGFARFFPWKHFFLLFFLGVIVVPAFIYGVRQGNKLFPATTSFASGILNARPTPIPTPAPTFTKTLPQVGSLLYTVLDGDSCVEILAVQMRMADAGEIFSDLKPETVRALNRSLGQDCHKLQPGMVLPLTTHYPLVALGGVVRKIDATGPQQVVPTPLIHVPNQDLTPDCSEGCMFTVQIAPNTEVHLIAQTSLGVHLGAWIWTKATLARKAVAGFEAYPYVDPNAALNGMTLSGCDFEVGTVHDPLSPSCNHLGTNTINDDGGSWLYGVTGAVGLDHWHYSVHAPAGTRVLLWLTEQPDGQLVYQKGNPAYRYDEVKHLYVGL